MWKMSGVLALAVLLPASAAGAATLPKDELVYVEGSDIATLDGAFVVDVPSMTLLRLVYNNLVKLNRRMEIEPDLAMRWEISPDRLTWTFHLRPGVKFSDGTPLTAEAVKFTLERMLDRATAAPNRIYFAEIAGIQVVDDLTLRITTSVPFPDLLFNLTQRGGNVLNPAVVRKWGVKDYGQHPVGSGPFMLKEWQTGDRLAFEVNPHYWGPKPKLRRIVYRPVPEASVRAAMLITGEADLAVKIEPEEIPNLDRNPNVKWSTEESTNAILLEILMDRKPFDDVRVRRALNMAIDREAIIKNVLRGLGTPHCSPVGLGVGVYIATFDCHKYDPAGAMRLLAEVGYSNGFDMELWASNGRYLKDRQVAEAVQGYLKAVGINARLTLREWAAHRNVWLAKDRQVWMIGRAVPGADFTFTRLYTKAEWDKGANNNTHFSDARVEDLARQGRVEFDVQKRKAIYRELQKIVWDAAPAIYLHLQKQLIAMRRNVQGLVVIPTEELVLEGVSKE